MHVYAQKVDLITYEENFLIFEDAVGKAVATGELDEGFKALLSMISMKLNKFPLGWREQLEREAPAPPRQIWCREV
jgi:hypothetical protein